MITQIRGRLIEKNPTNIVVDCGGVGYFINISLNTYTALPLDENIMLYTYLQVKEDSHTLYGFMSKAEREVFVLLLSVSGVGASTARTMLSSLTAEQVRTAIVNGEVSVVQSVKGIGAKTAQRIILDLKDKMLKVEGFEEAPIMSSNFTQKEEAISALEVLGFTRKQSERVVDKILKEQPSIKVEEIIKQSLKIL